MFHIVSGHYSCTDKIISANEFNTDLNLDSDQVKDKPVMVNNQYAHIEQSIFKK